MAPIEATLRTQLEDIVRRCLARMAENFQFFNEPPFAAEDTTTPLPGLLPRNEPHNIVPPLPFAIPAPGAAIDFFQEPPHLDAEASASAPSVAQPGQGALPTDSGYGSNSCPCSCHLAQNYSVPVYSRR